MKPRVVLLLVLAFFMCSSCGIKDSIKEVSDKASTLLEEISDLTRTIDSKVENDQIQENLANLLEEKLVNLSVVLSQLIEQNGGFLFEQVNGSVDNLFYNTSQLISDIKNEFMGDAVISDIIEQFSSQIEMQVSMLAGHLEDMIILTTGSVVVVIDKTTNSIIVITSIILLAIGMIIFVIIMFRKKTVVRKFGIVLMLVFIVFFASILVIKPLRANIIAGLDFGEEVEKMALSPKVRGVLPASFTVGEDKRIIIYGTHLDRIDTLGVALTLNQNKAYNFKDKNIIVATPNKIVLGNFDTEQNWKIPTFLTFRERLEAKTNLSISVSSIKNYSAVLNSTINPRIENLHTLSTIHVQPAITQPLIVQPVLSQPTAQPIAAHSTIAQPLSQAVRMEDINSVRLDAATRNFGVANANVIEGAIRSLFSEQYDIPEGDYGLMVYNAEEQVPSPQFISIIYPPPPVPDPDIKPVNITWTGNRTPSKGESASLTFTLKIDYPNQVDRRFKYRVTSTPPTSSLETMVTEGEIAAASSNGYTTVTTRNFPVVNPGNYQFKVEIDRDNAITESNESNNSYTKQLQVKDYVFDVTVLFSTFQSKQRMDGNDKDEYRTSYSATVTGNTAWNFPWNKDGTTEVYQMNKAKTFNSVNTPALVQLVTSGYEKDNDGCSKLERFFGTCNYNDYMGIAYYNISIPANPTGSSNQKEYPFTLNASKYKVTGRVRVTKRVL